MPTFIMLTRLNPDAVRSPRGLEQLERDAMKRVRRNALTLSGLAAMRCWDRAIISMSLLRMISRPRLEFPPSFGLSAMLRPKSGRRPSGTDSRKSSARFPDLDDPVGPRVAGVTPEIEGVSSPHQEENGTCVHEED